MLNSTDGNFDSDAEWYEDELSIGNHDEEDDEEDQECDEDDEEMKRKKDQIAELRRDNDESSVRCFSRACRVCNTSDPQARVVYPECGHAVCRECADETSAIMFDAELEIGCPLCGVEGGITPLYEDRIEEIDAASNTPAPHFSRSCSICCTETPLKRAVFTECGHITCLACAEQLAIDADDWGLEEEEDDEEEEDEGGSDEDDLEEHATESNVYESSDADICADGDDGNEELDEDEEYDEWNPLSCPHCKTEGRFVELVEEEIEDVQ